MTLTMPLTLTLTLTRTRAPTLTLTLTMHSPIIISDTVDECPTPLAVILTLILALTLALTPPAPGTLHISTNALLKTTQSQPEPYLPPY